MPSRIAPRLFTKIPIKLIGIALLKTKSFYQEFQIVQALLLLYF